MSFITKEQVLSPVRFPGDDGCSEEVDRDTFPGGQDCIDEVVLVEHDGGTGDGVAQPDGGRFMGAVHDGEDGER